jgi:uncharacterized membrane protein YqhA
LSKNSKEKIKQEKKKKLQMGLGLSFSRFEIFYKIKRKLREVEKNFTVLPFWQNGWIWASISTMIGITIISTLLIGKFYSQLPPEVPIVFIPEEEKWMNLPRLSLFTVPLILIIVGIINIYILQKVYYMNKRLTLMICLILVITYILELVGINEILIISTS